MTKIETIKRGKRHKETGKREEVTKMTKEGRLLKSKLK